MVMYNEQKCGQIQLSRKTRRFLADEGIHDVMSLQNMSIYEFLGRCKFHSNADETIDELVAWGIMQEIPGEVKISDLDISPRLRNILHRAYMRYLSQVAKYSREDLMMLRNLGAGTLQELLSVCEEYGVKVWSVKDLPIEVSKCGIHPLTYAKWYADGITDLSDLSGKSQEELLELCDGNEKGVKKIMEWLRKAEKRK